MVKRVYMNWADACPQPYADRIALLEWRITKIESHRDMLISALRHDIVTMETSAIRKPHLVRRAALSRAAIAECETDT